MGQVAVAYVVMNRVKSKHYPNTICEVIYQRAQFDRIKYTKPDFSSKDWRESVTSAVHVYLELVDDPTSGAKWFYSPKNMKPKGSTPFWVPYKTEVAYIGGHKFYTKP